MYSWDLNAYAMIFLYLSFIRLVSESLFLNSTLHHAWPWHHGLSSSDGLPITRAGAPKFPRSSSEKRKAAPRRQSLGIA